MYPFHHQGEYLIHGLLLLKYLPLISDHQFETESIQFENCEVFKTTFSKEKFNIFF